MVDLSLSEARRIALAAQGLASPRPRMATASALLAAVDKLGVLQIDAVNVLARAHYLPLFSRHGAYRVGRLDDAAYGPSRKLFEYWGHQASLIPTALQPLLRWRMERAANFEGSYAELGRFVQKERAYVDDVLAQVRERGPLRAGDLSSSRPRTGGWWGWSDAKKALEWLFWAGFVTTSHRVNFERLYDLPERVLPPDVLSAKTPSVDDAKRELLRLSAKALGIATEDDLADYFRLRLADVRPRLAELASEGALAPVRVQGMAKRAWLATGSELPRTASGQAILSPFDPLVWYRARSERLFGFRYRIEIYTPEPLREYGYYVLPFLLGESLVARVDLKAARETSTLRVQAAHLEPGASAAAVAPALADELRLMAGWLELEQIVVVRKGSLALALGRAVKSLLGRASGC